MNAISRTLGFINEHPLARRERTRAYGRFLSWQLRSRLQPQRLFAFNFVGQTRFLAKKQLTGITGSIYTGLQDFEEMAFLLHFLREGDYFFDIGANVGAYSILASGVCKARSLAFEPDAQTFALLSRNVALNELEPLIESVQCGVGSKKSIVQFTKDGDTTNHVRSDGEDAQFEEVQFVPLNDFTQHHPALLKIDVEGFETEVLQGAANVLQDPALKAIIIELNGSGNRYGFDETAIHRQFLAHGFMPNEYAPYHRTLKQLESFGDKNTIYIRDYAFVKERLQKARSFKVWGQSI